MIQIKNNMLQVEFPLPNDVVWINGIEFKYSLVKITDFDIDTERYNKLHIVTENALNHQEVDIDLTQVDIYDVLRWFGFTSLNKLRGKIIYKLVQEDVIKGFMHTALDDFDERFVFLFTDYILKPPKYPYT